MKQLIVLYLQYGRRENPQKLSFFVCDVRIVWGACQITNSKLIKIIIYLEWWYHELTIFLCNN